MEKHFVNIFHRLNKKQKNAIVKASMSIIDPQYDTKVEKGIHIANKYKRISLSTLRQQLDTHFQRTREVIEFLQKKKILNRNLIYHHYSSQSYSNYVVNREQRLLNYYHKPTNFISLLSGIVNYPLFIRKPRLSLEVIKRLTHCYMNNISARKAALLNDVNRNTVNAYYLRFAHVIIKNILNDLIEDFNNRFYNSCHQSHINLFELFNTSLKNKLCHSKIKKNKRKISIKKRNNLG